MSPTGTRRPRHPTTLIEAARRLFMIAVGRPGATFDPSWLRGAGKTDELVAIANVIQKSDLNHDLHVPQGWQLIPRLMEDRVRAAVVRELDVTAARPEAVAGRVYEAILATAASPEHSDPERMQPPATTAVAARRLRLARLFLEHSTHTYGDHAPNEIRTLLGLLDDAEAALER
jgi:hypothetical protein